MKTNTKIGKIGLISIVFLIFFSLFLGQSSVYAASTTGGTQDTKAPVHISETINQTHADAVNDLHIDITVSLGKITGWNVTVSVFPDITSTLNFDGNKVAVNASGADIPQGTHVDVDVKVWKSEPKASVTVEKHWTRNGTLVPDALPKQQCSLGLPIPDPGNPGHDLHLVTLTNVATTDYLNVTGLAFNATMDWYENLTQIIFPSPYPDFALAPGESWSTNVTTLGTLDGGHIYFRYSITGWGNLSDEWVDFPVTIPVVGGIVEFPQMEQPGAVTPDSSGHNYGALAGIIIGAIVGVIMLISAVWYIRRRRTKAI
jgi:hypothetical protein